ncbi:gamma-glutamylcyclotransferase [Paracoccus alkenifer]|uniref:glutathione-specific gamma-glutamylcyclotransferase n=1 Tax=Paracoccus alkenifer TaxID=65735 RepID=A0A1H6L1T9_9RHOB|nr:gamma-glutamylcyclotransferase [Paracoccus alkenifer]SEH82115.1 cation transport protein ChaC [Paracoccus alkenifer]
MDKGFWVFGYGSLMWAPGFPVAERVIAHTEGWRRSFCLRSVCHRGTLAQPGLVLGLEPCEQASCTGLALRIDDALWPEVIAAIRTRELVTQAYREASIDLALADGRRVAAVTYVMRPEHRQYAAGLSPDEQAAIIAAAHGGRGPNADYLFNTVAHLAELGIPDDDMAGLAARVRALKTSAA